MAALWRLRFAVVSTAWLATTFDGVGAARAGSAEPPAESVVGVAAFEDWSEVNRIVVDLAPEGNRPLKMLLDTGATSTILTPRFARALGVTVRRTKSSPYRRATFLGRDLQFWIDTSSSDTASRTGWEYGLLGGEFLAGYVIELDFVNRRVRFLDARKYRVPESVEAENETVLPLEVVSNRPIVKIELNGKPLSVMFDTGAPTPLILPGRAASKLGVDVDALPPFGAFGTVKGPMEVRLYEADDFAFGGFRFERMPVFVAPRGWYNQGTNTDSVIGYDAISQFTVRIDYRRRRLWLRRERSDVTYLGAPYTETAAAGLFLHPSPDAFIVVGVTPGSAAHEFGLEVGDAIPIGEQPLTVEQVIAHVTSREPLRVARPTDDAYAEFTLPVGAEEPAVEGESAAGSDDRESPQDAHGEGSGVDDR